MTGRAYRACGCRDSNGKQLGAKCLTLATNKKHGTWYYAVRVDRKTLRKGGFTSKAIASAELKSVVGRVEAGVKLDPKQTTGHYLLEWLASRRHDLAPKTAHQYRMYIDKDIVPALGKITLEQLHHEHVERMVSELEKAGRGATTITRIIACLSSALSDGVKRHRISHNVAQYVTTPKTASAERAIWTATQAIMFLEAAESDRLAPFFETIIGTGLRRGEAMGLRWADVDIDRAALRVRQSISEVGGKLTFGPPKTAGSAAGVGLSGRVLAALEVQRDAQVAERGQWATAYVDHDLVFARQHGEPLRPRYILARFHAISDKAGLPRARIHDLRHLAATLMISSGVPLPLVSKTLRHSRIAITADLYGHLTEEAAHAAATGLESVLNAAKAERDAETAMRSETTSRQHRALST